MMSIHLYVNGMNEYDIISLYKETKIFNKVFIKKQRKYPTQWGQFRDVSCE